MFQLFTQLKNMALVRYRVTCQENKNNLWKTKDWEIYRENATHCRMMSSSLPFFFWQMCLQKAKKILTQTHIKEALMLFSHLQNTNNMLSQVVHKTLQSPTNLSEMLPLNHSISVFHYRLIHLVHSWRGCLILLLRITVF